MKQYILLILLLLYAVKGVADDPKKIIIRGDKAFPPYEFLNDKGEPDGFNIDLTRAIMEELNLPYDLQLQEWPDVVRQFGNQEADLITGIAKSNERNDKFNLSQAHSYINYDFVCRKNSPVRNAGELSHKIIIVQENSVSYEKLKSMHYNNLIVVDNMVEGLKILSEGKGDVAICPDNMAKYIIYKDGLTNLDIINSEWPPREYCLAANDPQLLEQINTALLKLKKNGEYDRIYTKWLESKTALHIPMWIYFLIGTLLLTALLLTLFVHIYKQKAQKGEALLKKENEKLNALLLENKNLLNRYLTVFNTTLVGLSYYDKDGILVNVNDEMAKLFQMDAKSKLLEKRVSIYENPILRQYGIIDGQNQIHEFHGMLKYDMRKEICSEYFARFTPYDKIFYFKMDVTPIQKPDGKLEGILITAIDQTEEVNYNRQLTEEEEKLNLAMEAGDISAWIYDLRTQTFNTLHGKAIAGKDLSLEENNRILHPDDRKMQKEIFDTLIRGEKKTVETTFRYLHEDGTYHYYESHMIAKKEDSQATAILGTQKDITKEVQNNKILHNTVEKLRFAIQTASMAMWEYDCKTQMFTSYNDPIADYKDGALISMHTYDSSFEQEGTNWKEVANATEIMKNGEDKPYSIIVKLKTKYDSDWQYCTIRGVPMEKDETGRVIKYLGVRLNITEQIKYQKILEDEKEQAQQADKLKSAFLANMSHEIRTPLNAIVGFSELLLTAEDPDTRTEYMNIISKNNELLLRLINDILDLSKIESGLIELKPEIFDLTDVFNEMFITLKQRSSNPKVKFLGDNPYKSCKVKLDKNRLVQVGTNFITNAIKHTQKGHILIGYEYTSGGVKIYVQDTGAGIPKDKQSKLFQRFAKLDDFTQGTGLGLAICKATTDAQGGKIGFESEEGKGSTFWAWFPCEAEIEKYGEEKETGKVEEKTSTSSSSHKTEEPDSPLPGKSVLVAEDIDSNYLLIKNILKTFNLTRAKNGKEAVELARTHTYDAILMDIKMPVMSGIEATRKIREFDPSTLIIAVTANAFDSDREEALKAGCNAFVTKPIKKSNLEELLQNIN